jgi:hypothetical protein
MKTNDLGTRWKWVISSVSWLLDLWGRILGTHWIRGWVVLRAGLDPVEKRKILHLSGIGPRQASLWPMAIPAELSQLPWWDSTFSNKIHICVSVCVFMFTGTDRRQQAWHVFHSAFEEVTIGKKKDIPEIIIMLSLLCIFLPWMLQGDDYK